MNRILFTLAIMVATLSGCKLSKDPLDVGTWTVAATDPVFTVGHGVMLNSEGQEIQASLGFRVEAQRFYLKSLYQRSNQQQRVDFDAKHHRLHGSKSLTQQEQLEVNSALIAWLIEVVKPENAATLATKNTALRGPRSRRGNTGAESGILERLKREGL